VAGIANGLIMEGDDYCVLTDIMGLEDHLGDMDFKVTGTVDGITAMQMDIKIEGISEDIMEIALAKAKVARLYLLEKITACIPEPRKEVAETAPRIESIKIDPDKIGAVIGSGGKMIKHIIEVSGAAVDIDDDGNVSVSSNNGESIKKAMGIIKDIVTDAEIGKVYRGTVSRIESYGAFVKFMSDTKEGLVHISELHTGRINSVTDMVKVGDEVNVKVIGYDRGKVKLSMKNVSGNAEPAESAFSLGNSSDRPRNSDRRNDRDRRPKRDYGNKRNDNRRY
jgi:polyribonucleotide nucleotidyltransferase